MFPHNKYWFNIFLMFQLTLKQWNMAASPRSLACGALCWGHWQTTATSDEWGREWDSCVHLVFQGEGTREGKREQKRRCSEGDIWRREERTLAASSRWALVTSRPTLRTGNSTWRSHLVTGQITWSVYKMKIQSCCSRLSGVIVSLCGNYFCSRHDGFHVNTSCDFFFF